LCLSTGSISLRKGSRYSPGDSGHTFRALLFLYHNPLYIVQAEKYPLRNALHSHRFQCWIISASSGDSLIVHPTPTFNNGKNNETDAGLWKET
jgi:hypothetical protein